MNEQIYFGHYQMTRERPYTRTFSQFSHFFCSQDHDSLTLHGILRNFFSFFSFLNISFTHHFYITTSLTGLVHFLTSFIKIDSLLLIFLNSPDPFNWKCCSTKRQLQSGYKPAQESTRFTTIAYLIPGGSSAERIN